MKVRVVKPFKDKHTKVVYQTGQEIEVAKERFEELTSAALGPFVETVEKTEKEDKEVKKTIKSKKIQKKAKK